MVRDRQHGPVVELNRIQVQLETHTLNVFLHIIVAESLFFFLSLVLSLLPLSHCEAMFQTGS